MLTEEQYLLVREYCSALNSVEEGFEYVVESFTDLDKTDGDQLLVNIFDSFSQIVSVNEQLMNLFPENDSIMQILDVFDAVLEKAEEVEWKFEDAHVKQMVIREQFYPVFAAWHRMIDRELKPYIVS
ncbi:hypothetical protein [Cytobacillus purgationiresistens]|uniref:ASC-1-like (ASCH) protein n=1 Tax=Cytobacillus purgationiresistens TaxID=863449 RepID=A0ABU0ACW0_9BACI|nr:hypothetical protein [Cytobacillus purgationiresistens]MDQ0269083.1 ASC-1-like (ASCH) protein [Cytobacillus purgationiresistens]